MDIWRKYIFGKVFHIQIAIDKKKIFLNIFILIYFRNHYCRVFMFGDYDFPCSVYGITRAGGKFFFYYEIRKYYLKESLPTSKEAFF